VPLIGFSRFVTSMTAPVASGWSGCRVGLAPTGKRRLFTTHATREAVAQVLTGPRRQRCNVSFRQQRTWRRKCLWPLRAITGREQVQQNSLQKAPFDLLNRLVVALARRQRIGLSASSRFPSLAQFGFAGSPTTTKGAHRRGSASTSDLAASIIASMACCIASAWDSF
jgi:hypothetical protein